MSQALAKLKRWIGDKSQTDVAAQLGCTQSMLSRLLDGKYRINIDLAAAIERATEGAIRATDWSDPMPRRDYKPLYSRKGGVRRKVGARS